ncbi:uncharacterized protein [Anabrus simplex]|uniref:uncharacterized protein n=1 Tax=Anabrus simplex TaxID=316456 RepID=UPI0034DD9B05
MMTQPLPSSRKRVRSNNCEEECCDFMPLSKRINNLHINNGNCCIGLGHLLPKHSALEQDIPFEGIPVDDAGSSLHTSETLHLGFCTDSERNDEQLHHRGTNCNIVNHSHTWMTSQVLAHYSPDLNASDNPYYYESNKLLFALYMERMQRSGQELF